MSFLLLAGNLLAIFAADTLYVMQQLNGTYQTGNFLDAIWLCGNLALGAAALHPTVARVADRASADDMRLTRFRLAVLAGGRADRAGRRCSSSTRWARCGTSR